MSARTLFLAALVLAMAATCQAQEFERTVKGRHVTVEKTDDGSSLSVDGQEMLSEFDITVDRVLEVDGVTVAVGIASAGGNACEGAPYVLVLGSRKAPRLDGPLDTCSPMEPEEEQGRLIYSEPEVPGQESQRWSWTPHAGFETLSATPYSPDDAKGWDDLATDEITHPADLLGYGAVAAMVDDLAGSRTDEFADFVTGIGSAERQDELVFGSACLKADCPENGALLVADTQAEQVYLAWKPAGKKILVRPPVGQWPEKPRALLRNWASAWN